MAPKKKVKDKVAPCVPVFEEPVPVDDDGNPTIPNWPAKRGPNPCCPGSKPPTPEQDPTGRLTDLWYEYRDQWCPVYVDPPDQPKPDPPKPDPPIPPKSPRPDPDPPFGTGGTMSNYTIPGGDRSMEILYPDGVPGPFGTGNWAL